MNSEDRLLSQRLWALAWPLIITNSTQPLLGLIDTALLGHLPNQTYIGASALGTSLLALLFWGFGFLRMGTTGFVARARGQGDSARGVQIALQHGALACLLALLVIAAGPALLPWALTWLGASESVTQLALSYTQIRLFAAPATLLTYVLIGWFIAMQRMRAPLYIMLATQLTNIALDVVFIVVLDWRSDGAAWASLSAEYVGLLTAAALFCQHPAVRGQLSLRGLHIGWQSLLLANQHLMLRTWALLGVLLFFTSQGAQLGDQILAANAILLQLVHLASYCLDGLAHATESLIGSATGARQRAKQRRLLQLALAWSAGVAALLALVFWLGQWPLIRLMSDLPEVIQAAHAHYFWAVWLPLISVGAYVLDGYCIGSGQTRAMRDTLIGAALIIFLPCWWLAQGFGNHGLWFAFLAFNASRGLGLAAWLALASRHEDSKS